MPQKVQVYFFGELKILIGQKGSPLLLPPTQKSQSLLAYLIYHRQTSHPRSRLIGMFWGDRPEKRARRSLSTALWHIRRSLNSSATLSADNHKVHLDGFEEIWVDAETFADAASAVNDLSRLERAVSLYTGNFLDGSFDDWVIDQRYLLQEKYLDALSHLMGMYASAGRPRAALHAALTLLQQNPLREDAHRTAMRAYIQLGRRNDALFQFDQCRRLIAEELGTVPTPETIALHEAILLDELVKSPDPEAAELDFPQSQIPWRKSDPFSTTGRLPLMERETIWQKLMTAWETVEKRHTHLHLIQGEAGVGKSRLLTDFAAAINQLGGQVLHGRCYEFERRLPYQPLAEAIQQVLTTLPAEDLSTLPSWVTAELARLIPELGPTSPAGEAESLFQAFVFFLKRLANTTTLLFVIDDLQWANESTLAMLHHLIRHSRQMPLLLVAAYRDVLPPALQNWQLQIMQNENAEHTILTRLSAAGVRSMIEEISHHAEGAQELADYLYQDTEGNPYFLSEMVKHLLDGGALFRQESRWQINLEPIKQLSLPTTISAAIMTRLQRLSTSTQSIAHAAAMLGQSFDYDHLLETAAGDENNLLTALDDLLRHQLIIENPAGVEDWDYAFTHHKIQETIVATLPRHRRLHLHKQLAFVLERRLSYAPEAAPIIPQVAFHFEQARQLDKSLTPQAVIYLFQAGQQAAAQFAHAEAIAFFSRAFTLVSDGDLQQRYELLLARESTYAKLGNRSAQEKDLDLLVEVSAKLEDPAGRAEVAIRQGRCFFLTGNFDAAIDAAQRAIDLAGEDPIKRARAHLVWGEALLSQSDHQASRAHFEKARALAQTANNLKIEADSLNDLGRYYMSQSDYSTAEIHYAQALAIYQNAQVGSRIGEGNILGNLGIICRELANYAAARDYFEQARQVFQQLGDRHKEGLVIGNMGVVATDMGDILQAKALFTQGLEISREVDDRNSAGYWLNNLSRISTHLGDFEGAKVYLEEALSIFREIGDRQSESMTLNSLGLTLTDEGKFKQAAIHYQQALDVRRAIGDRRGEGYCNYNLGSLALLRNAPAAAQDSFDQAFLVFSEIGERQGEAQSIFGRGRLAAALGDWAAAQKLLLRALNLFREIGNKEFEGETLCALGLLAIQQEQFETAIEKGREGLELAQQANDMRIEAAASIILAEGWLESGQIAKAKAVYQQALKLRRRMGQKHLITEALAGLVRLALRQKQPVQALETTKEILKFLEEDSAEEEAIPLHVYLTCYHSLQAAGDPRAALILGQANSLLQKAAAGLTDERKKRSFLNHIPTHSKIRAIADDIL